MKHLIFFLVSCILCTLHAKSDTIDYSIPLTTLSHNLAQTRVVLQQLLDHTLAQVHSTDEHLDTLSHVLKKIEQKTREIYDFIIPLIEHVHYTDKVVRKLKNPLNAIKSEVCTIKDIIDTFNTLIVSIQENFNVVESSLDNSDTILDELQEESESTLDKACDLESLVEKVADTTSQIEAVVNSLIDITENTNSVTDAIDSKEDIMLSKVCTTLSNLDAAIQSGTNMIISSFDDTCSQINTIQSTADITLDKSCDILSLVDIIDSKVDTLETTVISITDTTTVSLSIAEQLCSHINVIETIADSVLDKVCMLVSVIDDTGTNTNPSLESILDKSCDILSITENINSSVEVIQSTADIIESKVCQIKQCDFMIIQDDIPFTITQPGLYCLGENVTFDSGNAITITSDNVTLNLKGHTIDGEENIQTIAINASDVSNVTIQNGFIQGTSAGVRIQDSDGPVMISDINVINGATVDDQVDTEGMVGGIVLDNTHNVTVQNCSCAQLSPVGFHARNGSSHCIFRHCTAQLMTHAGFVADNTSSFCIFEHCTASENTTEEIESNFINDYGFIPPLSSHQLIGGPAFGIYGNNSCAQWCKAHLYNFDNRFDGGIINLGLSGIFDIRGNRHRLDHCFSTNNFTSGYIVSGRGHTVFSCIALNNGEPTGNGFTGGANGIIANMQTIADFPLLDTVFHNCISINNEADGFGLEIIGSSGVEYKYNLGCFNGTVDNISNQQDGFDAFPMVIGNKYISNIAIGNEGFGIRNNVINNVDDNKYFNNFACDSNVINPENNLFNIPLIHQATDTASYWVNVNCATTIIGIFHSKICEIQESLNDFVAGP